MAVDLSRCPHCGHDVAMNAQRCPQCQRALAGKALMEDAQRARGLAGTAYPGRTSGLIAVALISAAISVLVLNSATAGVGILAFACLCAIMARIAQAGTHHNELLAELEKRR